jgi:RNA polymerase sigma factor (sigma-70 family)
LRSWRDEADPELVRAAAEGTPEAFEELYRRHSQAAWAVALNILGDVNDAADAVAEAFARTFPVLSGIEGVGFRAYLISAVRQAAIALLGGRTRISSLQQLEEDAALRRHDYSEGPQAPELHVMASEDQRLVAEAFARLPERCRTALWLIEVEELSTKEVGSILGVQPVDAAQLATSGRRRLREYYLASQA